MKSSRFLIMLAILTMLPVLSAAKETKDIPFTFKNAEPVIFSHDLHLEKYKNNCKICHNAIFNIKQKKKYTMAEMEATKSCGACHTGVKAFSIKDEKFCTRCHKGKPRAVTFKVKGAPEVAFSHDAHVSKAGLSCRSCHDGKIITGKLKGVADAVFSHQVHIGMFKCPDCHTKVFQYKAGSTKATMASMEKGKSCGTCHNGKDAFTAA